MLTKKLFVVSTLALSFVGCTKMTPAQLALDNVNSGGVGKSSRPECEIQQTEYVLDPTLIAFEITDSGGLRAGFSLFESFLKLISLDFKAASGKLSMGLALRDPMVPNLKLVTAMGGGRSFKFDSAVDVGFQSIGAGFSYSHSTPLATLTKESLEATFADMFSKMTEKQSEWRTQVFDVVGSNQFVIPAGSFANIKKGDVFAIYNVEHKWAGKPCASNYVMGVETTTTPLVIARADQVENNGTLLTMICSEQNPCNTSEKVEIGATVRIHQLTEEGRTLARIAKITEVASAVIQYEQNKKVDLSPYIKEIVNVVAGENNFLVYAQ